MIKRLALGLICLLYPSIYAEAASRFAVCTTACTWDGSSTLMWSATSGGATGASVPGSSDTVTLDASTCVGGVTCTITVNTTVTLQSISMGSCTASTTGCVLDFSANNNDVTLSVGGFNGSGSGVRRLNLGNGTWTLTGTGSIWSMSTTTNLTFNANSSVLTFTKTTTSSRNFLGGGLTYATVTISANTSGGIFSPSGNNTIATLNVTAPNFLALSSSETQTITNAFTWTGTSSAQNLIGSNSPGFTATIAAAASSTMSWAGIRDVTFTGSPTATNSFDLGHNSGITITAPTAGGGGIIGGWVLRRDLGAANDNTPAWLNLAA